MGWADCFCQSLLIPAASAVLVVIVAYFVAKYVSRIASAPVRKRVDETLGRFIGKLVFNLIIIGTGVGVLGTFGVNVTSFAAILGAAGFAIGLAFQGTLSNFAAGILLLVFRPFKVGDMVVVAGMNGKVNEIDLFTTTLDTPDNRRIIVPNSSIAGNTIENVTYHAERRVEVTVGIGYDCSIEETRTALTQAMESLGDKVIAGEGRGFQIIMSQFGAHSVDWIIRAWAKTIDFAMVREEMVVAIKQKLDQAGLRIPYPQLDIHFDAAAPVQSAEPTLQDLSKQKPRMRHGRVA